MAEHDKQPEQTDETDAAQARENDPAAGEADAQDAAAAEGEQEAVARLEAEVIEARDQALRAQADAQNAARRAEQEVEKARKFALEGFAKELLPVVDNLERALEAASGDDEAVKAIAEGVDLTLKSFQGALGKFHIEALDPLGEPFDPNLHQAMSMVENGDVEPNTVIAVMMKGYTLNGRLLRPAMVMVSKAPG
ncbi:MAG: nucleotide exchange factor GrpE [Pseudomonadales bacterium]|nr:nucleotide exchange factor GrpE [Pseudomonadales bacterium]MCP5191212.1 nucleotide exchange factor GrpE [Pseudomonadales bacterium]